MKIPVIAWLLVAGFIAVSPPGFSLETHDGIWFLGFNLHKDAFAGQAGRHIREGVARAIDAEKIVRIAGATVVPSGFIPPGLPGFRKTLPAQKAGRPANLRLKSLSLLHTDGRRTIEIAKIIQGNLKKIGMTVERTVIPFSQQARWQEELESGRHHLFLMGYKDERGYGSAEAAMGPDAAPPYTPDPAAILQPLFHSRGEANFSFYRNAEFDSLIEQADALGNSKPAQRDKMLREANAILVRDVPAVVLFYIPRI